MSMHIQLEFRPGTLGEAKLAEEIIESVKAQFADRVTLSGATHRHEVARPASDDSKSDGWMDSGLVVVAGGFAHVEGAPVPRIRQVTRS